MGVDAGEVGWEGLGMTISRVDLRERWVAGQPCHGVWSLLPGAVTGEVLARTGADFVVVDLQHGAVTEAELPGVAAAITAAGSVPLVRTRSASFADVGRPLDLGACGVIVPSVRDADHAREVVAATVTPRQVAVGRAALRRARPAVGDRHGGDRDRADDLDAVLDVQGVEGIYVGPGDLSLSLDMATADRRDDCAAVLSTIIARAGDAGVPVGVHAYDGDDAAGSPPRARPSSPSASTWSRWARSWPSPRRRP